MISGLMVSLKSWTIPNQKRMVAKSMNPKIIMYTNENLFHFLEIIIQTKYK